RRSTSPPSRRRDAADDGRRGRARSTLIDPALSLDSSKTFALTDGPCWAAWPAERASPFELPFTAWVPWSGALPRDHVDVNTTDFQSRRLELLSARWKARTRT